jgi:RHS repeat-associated protein
MDFSVTGSSGQITYDLNGNILTMLQKGVMPGNPAPLAIDDLHYTYASYSNKLLNVTDQMTVANLNGLSGDFKDGSNTTGSPDYVYDANGNVVVDLNKNVQSLNNGAAGTSGISYNFLDKPEQIRIPGKGTIQIVYSGDGTRLKRTYTPENGGVATSTTYVNEFVYQSSGSNPDALAYINFEAGRVRVTDPISQDNGYDALAESGNVILPSGKSGAYDYFIIDYQKNVRMILTEASHVARNTCTMETARTSSEDPVFGQTGAANEVETTRYPTPAGWQNINTSASVSRLGNLAGYNIGPNTLQKVMAGDQVTATAQYYYQSPSTSGNPSIIPNILNSLVGAISGGVAPGGLVKGNATAIANQLNGTPGFIAAVQPSSSTGGTPQAYLTILFFDERFNFIEAADGGVAQQQVDPSWTPSTAPLGLVNIKAPRNGYAFVYVSNRSDQDVYFDNLVVGVNAGNIIEENHYYAFGLRIAAISSHKLGDAGEGKLKNNYLYNNQELFDDGDLDWYAYGFRNYDPQIGRFVQIDPLADAFPLLSSYHYALNDPITCQDKNGLSPIPCPGTSGLTIFLDNVGSVITKAFEIASPTLNAVSLGVKAANAYDQVENAITVSGVINTQVESVQAGGNTAGDLMNGGSGAGLEPNDDPDDGFPKLPKYRIYFVYEQFTPETYKHIKEATSEQPSGEMGKPLLLHYDEFGSRSKKRYKNFVDNDMLKSYKDPWRDEYPFACTHEGASASVKYVPAWEQIIQRSELWLITQGLHDGDLIQVILIPKNSPPPIFVPQYKPSDVKKGLDWKPQPVLVPISPQGKPIDITPLAAMGAAALLAEFLEALEIGTLILL